MSYVHQGTINRTIHWCFLVGPSISVATLTISELGRMKRCKTMKLSVLSLHLHPVTRHYVSFAERTLGQGLNWGREEYLYPWKFLEDFRSDQCLFWDSAILLVAIKILFLYNDMRN